MPWKGYMGLIFYLIGRPIRYFLGYVMFQKACVKTNQTIYVYRCAWSVVKKMLGKWWNELAWCTRWHYNEASDALVKTNFKWYARVSTTCGGGHMGLFIKFLMHTWNLGQLTWCVDDYCDVEWLDCSIRNIAMWMITHTYMQRDISY